MVGGDIMTDEKTIRTYVCEVCGKKYIHNKRWSSEHTCSSACYKKRKANVNKEWRKKQTTKKSKTDKYKSMLEDDNTKALALGMTYGQYQAMKYLERKR
jgi:hypothetical protein